MKVRLHRVEMPLEHPFTIARGTRYVQRSLIVEIEENGVCGYGEATEHEYYKVTQDSLTAAIEGCRPLIEAGQYKTAAQLWAMLQTELCDNMFALAAIDAAAHDLFGKLAERPTFDMLGLKIADDLPQSSYTIGIDTVEKMVAKLRERPGWSIFKIKLGTSLDVEIIRQLRKHTDATFRVDANCGWTADETIDNSHFLKGFGVEFIEQPLPADADKADHRRVFENSQLPIVADESCLVESDIEECHGMFHGVNVKLSKCGGITPGFRMLNRARQLNMKTMVGCMVESTVGISAAAQLLPMLDYADIDGAELLAADAAAGVTIKNGVVQLSSRAGNGVELFESIAYDVS